MKTLIFLMCILSLTANAEVKCSQGIIKSYLKQQAGLKIKFLSKVMAVNMATAKIKDAGYLLVNDKCSVLFQRISNEKMEDFGKINPCNKEILDRHIIQEFGKRARTNENLVPQIHSPICNSL